MKDGEATTKPIKVGDAYYIVGLTKRQEASMDEFAQQRDTLMEQMVSQKRGEVFQDYISAVRLRMEQNGEIKIYNDVIAKLDEAALPFDLNQ
jgi:parvulin-like peptidyl-prolyl isomerase